MLGNAAFYNATIKKYVIAFAHIFDDVNVFRFTDQDLTRIPETFKVPIIYQNKNKMYQIRTQSNYASGIANNFPRMTFRLTGFHYDVDRQKQKYNVINSCQSAYSKIYVPKPYNIDFKLSIFTRNTDDTMMILEQVLSFFTPEYTMPITEISEVGIRNDVKFVISDDVELENPEETNIITDIDDDIEQTDISFTCYGNIYPPVKDMKIVKKLIIEFGLLNKIEEINSDAVIFEEIDISATE